MIKMMIFVTSIKNFTSLKKRQFGEGLFSLGDLLAQGLQVLVPGAGAGISLALGKFVVGGILALICIGVVVRLTLRRKNAGGAQTQNSSISIKAGAVFLALGLSAGFVEMTYLPVRFNQTGFSFWYWAIVGAVITVAYRWTLQILSKIFFKKAKDVQVIRLG